LSTTFFAPGAPAIADLSVNMASANAADLTVMLGLDSYADIRARGMVAGEVSALVILAAIRERDLDSMRSSYSAARLRDLRTLAEAAEAHGVLVAWA
jgi:hypothetical protein